MAMQVICTYECSILVFLGVWNDLQMIADSVMQYVI